VRHRGQREPELRSALRSWPRPDAAAHRLDEPGAHEEADTSAGRAARCARRPVVEVEKAVALVGREARPVVQHAHDRLVALVARVASSSQPPRRVRTFAPPKIVVTGVRSSWDSMWTKVSRLA